jgi:hypothetical protein|tara:strand:- start:1639 stop:2367 length:729 start_codon:yes stop_codon:yes gene_type:complete
MASTLKPFRQYSEHEVLNMFSLKPDTNDAHGDNCVKMIADGGEHTWDAGRLLVSNEVAMKASGGDWDPVTMNDGGLKGDTAATAWSTALKGYLGANYNAGRSGYANVSPDGSHVGLFGNTNATLTATADSLAAATDAAVGIALRSTLGYDENNEKLLYYTNKQDELQAVLPGDAVPCLRRGLIAMVVDGSIAAASAGLPVHGLDAATTKGGLVSITVNETAIGEIVAVMDVDQKICLVQIDV